MIYCFRKWVLGPTHPQKRSLRGEICTHLYTIILSYLFLMWDLQHISPAEIWTSWAFRISFDTILQHGFIPIITIQNRLDVLSLIYYNSLFLDDMMSPTVSTQAQSHKNNSYTSAFEDLMYFILVLSTIPHGINLIIRKNEFHYDRYGFVYKRRKTDSWNSQKL